MNCQLTVDTVRYRYAKGHDAVAGLDLQMGSGILGLLGPNGAGKSTLMRVLATLTRPTSGRVLWNGVDIARQPDALRTQLGYLPQDFGVYPALSAREFLVYLAAVKGLPSSTSRARVDDCLALVGLADAADRRLGDFSGGMRQRVGIAQALLNDPKLLIFDEPTVGLDPEERLRFRQLITDLAADRLVILSTHIVSDVEASATALAVMSKGRLLFSGAPEPLLAQAHGHVWEWLVPEAQVAQARAQFTISNSLRRPDGVRLRVVGAHPPSTDAQASTPDLEDAYLWLLTRDGGR
ncbi:ABC transporter ATP-binding protein [Montanilutibacter psychrotolerans]|uniref:ABC transporter ATP-binding protein n=1 Tax=Montanilutibacter psychrotolerans TaxID=1327343 RepID=A0A3M8SV36_9GAMM|nr:ABC transporter ATP-binding protein [Lysobacter psychrotolerans]RNF83094.1 ABC transporter ATP-binding protein [Lysobacter psychrotolerans]